MTAPDLETISAILPRAELTGSQMDEMFQLLARHFMGVTRRRFERDLAEKNWVILVTRQNRTVGFSTLLAYESSFQGQPVSVIYSGDILVGCGALRTFRPASRTSGKAPTRGPRAPRPARTRSGARRLRRRQAARWIVECPAIPGCVSQGTSKDEALLSMAEAIKLCLEVRAEQGLALTVETRQIEVAA